VGSLLGIHFLIFQTLIGKFVMESAPPTVQILILLLPIGKVGWKLFTLSVFCLRIGKNSKGVVEEKRGMISKWESVRICYFCVGLFLFYSSLGLFERKKILSSLIASTVSDSDKQKLSFDSKALSSRFMIFRRLQQFISVCVLNQVTFLSLVIIGCSVRISVYFLEKEYTVIFI